MIINSVSDNFLEYVLDINIYYHFFCVKLLQTIEKNIFICLYIIMNKSE